MKAFFLGITKLTLGIVLALVLLSLTGVATARYFMAKPISAYTADLNVMSFGFSAHILI
ncbi:MAG: hypothetical protein AAGF98_08455 [Cyanobacteria bacterium P01_H01_bin.153]